MFFIRLLPLVACLLVCFVPGAVVHSAHAQAVVDIGIDVEPPPLPDYEQPPIPEPGYLWVPGYWAWNDDVGYYWVPGTWVLPPEPGLLWTPGYWGWNDGAYAFYPGYWGPEVGYYGGVYYGYGYTGEGYEGGYWREGRFFYNSTVNNIRNAQIINVYSKTVIVNNRSRVSYNGGAGGTTARPTPAQLAEARKRHIAATPVQMHHAEMAAKDPALSLARNHGHPAAAATVRPGEFKGPGVVAAHPGPAVPARPAKLVPPGGPATTMQRNKPGSEPPQRKGVMPRTTTGPTPVPEKKSPTLETKRPERPMVKPVAPASQTPPPPRVTPPQPKPQTARPAPPPRVTPPQPKPQTARPAPPPRPTPPPPRPQTARPAPPPPAAQRPPPPAKPKCPPGQHCG